MIRQAGELKQLKMHGVQEMIRRILLLPMAIPYNIIICIIVLIWDMVDGIIDWFKKEK